MKPLFTVFTPSFDAAPTLERCFNSLARQTLKDFEWIIVDDGSTDGTRQIGDIALTHALWHKTALSREIKWFRHAPFEFLKTAARLCRCLFHSDLKFREQIKDLKGLAFFLAVSAAAPVYLFCILEKTAAFIFSKRRL